MAKKETPNGWIWCEKKGSRIGKLLCAQFKSPNNKKCMACERGISMTQAKTKKTVRKTQAKVQPKKGTKGNFKPKNEAGISIINMLRILFVKTGRGYTVDDLAKLTNAPKASIHSYVNYLKGTTRCGKMGTLDLVVKDNVWKLKTKKGAIADFPQEIVDRVLKMAK